MKIGIVTQPLHGNYGGILQNYALQEVLRSLGHDPITLDFQWGYSGLYWVMMSLRRLCSIALGRTPLSSGISIPYAPIGRNNKEINDFIDKYIKLTPPFWNRYRPSIIKKYSLDAVITGSDQVWRPRYNPRLTDMFLGFVNNNILKIAYGASFGTSEWEYTSRLEEKCSKLIKAFDAISVREKSGQFLTEKLGRDSIQVLDPTLLLGVEGFEKILPPKLAKNNLGAYLLDELHNYNQCLQNIADQVGCNEILSFTENESGMGPIQWLSTIRNSRFFLTDSFHGTVFCILFHVPFLTIINSDRGADRFHSLLESLNLKNRLVESYTEISAVNSDINWSDVDSKLEEMRKTSMEFLIQSIK